jgi:hypothetical protein
MAIDQRDVSSALRFMEDDVLQQYAAMHKSDPYIFPLAFQESQNRKKLRMNQQAQAGAMPQPKVADQALAQMAPPQPQPMPEDRGIATLPAPNMKFGAEGGIMGYEGYGEEPRQFGQESVLRMAEGGVARYQTGGSIQSKYQQESQEMGMGTRTQYSPDVQAFVQEQAQASRAEEQAYLKQEQQRALRGPYGNIVPTAPAAAVTPKVTPTYSQDDYSGMDRRIMSGSQLPSIQSITPPTKPAAKKDDTVSKADTTRRNTGDPSAARKEPAPETADVTKMFEKALEKADAKANPYETQLKAINAEKVKAGEENVSGLEAIQKQFSDIYKGKKERLDTRENEIGKMKDQSLGLALLNAGARMMQTRGSIGEAIGAGIDTGSKQYVAGLDKINAAKEKLSDARDRLEELEAQRGELSARELHKARNEVKSLTTAGMENLVQAAMAERKINRAEAVDFVKTQLTVATSDKDRASREKLAAISEDRADKRANAPSTSMREAMMLGTGNTPEEKYLSGLRVMKELTGDKQGTQLLKLFLEENGRREKNMEKPLTLDQFRRTSAAFYAPPAPVDTTKPTRP